MLSRGLDIQTALAQYIFSLDIDRNVRIGELNTLDSKLLDKGRRVVARNAVIAEERNGEFRSSIREGIDGISTVATSKRTHVDVDIDNRGDFEQIGQDSAHHSKSCGGLLTEVGALTSGRAVNRHV